MQRIPERERMSPPPERYDKYGGRPRSPMDDRPPPPREYWQERRPPPREPDYRDPPPYEHRPSYPDRPPSYREPYYSQEYSSLRLTGFPSHVSDIAVRDALFHEFKKYGEVNIRVTYSGEDRVAYANFRTSDCARAAKESKGERIVLFAKPLRIDCVYKRYDQSYGGGRGYNKYGPPEYQKRPGGPPGRYGPDQRYERDYNPYFEKGRKYDPHHSHERDVTLLPEEDPKATRTVFVGNLEETISEDQLRRSFDRFGCVEEVDIKYAPRGQGNPFAFIKFTNLDMAYKAIMAMSGQYIGRNQCKTGYGKVSPTTCLWVGGLGPRMTRNVLEREFDRFGAIRKIDYLEGDDHAFIFYEAQEAATAAASHLRGFPLGGKDRKLRIDFIDPERIPRGYQAQSSPPHRSRDGPPPPGYNYDRERPSYRERGPPGDYPYDREKGEFYERDRRSNSEWSRGPPPDDVSPYRHKRAPSSGSDYGRGRGERPYKRRSPTSEVGGGDWSPSGPPRRSTASPEPDAFESVDRKNRKRSVSLDSSDESQPNGRQRRKHKKPKTPKLIEGVTTIAELVDHFPVGWQGFYGLKNSAFATSMHLIGGDRTLVDSLLPDGETGEERTLRIAQRFRLDQTKLEEVGKRIYNAGPNGHSLLVGVPRNEDSKDLPTGTQARPLRNLVSYLQQKKAAGVIILPVSPSDDKEKGVLYAFPPCEYAQNHLLSVAPDLGPEPLDEDHIVVIIVKGVA